MKVVSWNVNSLRVRMPHLLQWLEAFKPDVVALQETKTTDEQFPEAELKEAGYSAIFSGQKTYNGVAILSRHPATDVLHGIPALDDEQKRVIAATYNGVRVIDVYVPNGEDVGSDKYAYKLRWLTGLLEYVKVELTKYPQLVLLGDFNIAPEDRDVRDPETWRGKVLCSDNERAAFQQLLAAGLNDSFRMFEQPEKTYSWWDYRELAFRRNRGLRIDHVLVSGVLAAKCIAAGIDKEPRRWERPSDHAPVWVELT